MLVSAKNFKQMLKDHEFIIQTVGQKRYSEDASLQVPM